MNEKKRFAAILPHSDDFTISVYGLMCKLLDEGYEGYWIRTTDDCMDSWDFPYGKTSQLIEEETEAVAAQMGIKKVYHLNYSNHDMNEFHLIELRHRLVTLFRFLKIDTVITFDPYGHYEENPDHYITGRAVEHAAWIAECTSDLPETFDMGLEPQSITTRYYYSRGPQESNYTLDITPYVDRKFRAISMNTTPTNGMWRGYLKSHPELSMETFTWEMFMEERFHERLRKKHIEKYRRIPELSE